MSQVGPYYAVGVQGRRWPWGRAPTTWVLLTGDVGKAYRAWCTISGQKHAYGVWVDIVIVYRIAPDGAAEPIFATQRPRSWWRKLLGL